MKSSEKTSSANGRGADIGILTFSCSDNYGAMMQTYALRTWLRAHQFDAQIVPYAPVYMTARHWPIPFGPYEPGTSRLKFLLRPYRIAARSLPCLPAILKQRQRFRAFRREALGISGRPLLRDSQLRRFPCGTLVVGSDQIWNPEITLGLRPAYFGAIPGWDGKVVSYAASFGAAELPAPYRERFAQLLRHVDVLSVRETEAAPFVARASGRSVAVMPDPSLLLTKEQWQLLEAPGLPLGQEPYILYHSLKADEQMLAYTKALAAEKHLKVIELRYRRPGRTEDFCQVYSAGPREFLAYIHRAEYVVSNSFHAVAASILYNRPFAAFRYSASDLRVRQLLALCGLPQRLYTGEGSFAVDEPVAWDAVAENIARAAAQAEDYLCRNLPRRGGGSGASEKGGT